MRPNIYEEYLKSQVAFLMATKNISEEEATNFVKKIANERNKPPTLTVLEYERPGYEVKKEIPFSTYATASKTNIVTPNGRVYVDPRIKPSRMRKYIIDLLAKRSYHKKRMFEFQQKGQKESEAMEKSLESKIKIAMNTITGGAKNSPYSCFYDKAGFNAVTSVARLMIKTNYSIYEQMLGGNFFWENQDELINNIILQLRHLPSKDKIEAIVEKYNLYQPTHEELLNRYQFFMNLYVSGPSYLHREAFHKFKNDFLNRGSLVGQYLNINNDTVGVLIEKCILNKPEEDIFDLKETKTLINSLEQHQITFLYYLNNLRALFWKNSKVFKPILNKIVSASEMQINEECSLNDIFSLDGDLVPIGSTKYDYLVIGKELKDIVKDEPEIARQIVSYIHYIFKIFSEVEDVVSLFCKTSIGITRTNIKEKMWRNTTLGSDTDSVLYTLKEWVKWFSGDEFDSSSEADVLQAIMTYYVAKTADHNMVLLSEHLGATGDDRFILKMKGEYDFQSLTFYDIKKHYTGVMDKQEGRVLPKVKLDIKGLGLRGSAIPKKSAATLEEFVLSTRKRQPASYFIRTVTSLESEMAKDLRNGSQQFLKSISVRTEDSYANAAGSQYAYLDFWNFVFGEKYGSIQPPLKAPSVFLSPYDVEVQRAVKEIDPIIHNKILQYYKKTGKKVIPSIVINPILEKVPEEIIVMMDMRKHIFTNARSLYLTLESYGIPMPHFQDNTLILSDYYTELNIKFMELQESSNGKTNENNPEEYL